MDLQEIYAFIFLLVSIFVFCPALLFGCLAYENVRNYQIDKFLSKLNDKEKALICDYDNVRRVIIKKHKIKFKEKEEVKHED